MSLHMMYNRSRIMKLMMNNIVAIPLPVKTNRIPLCVWGGGHRSSIDVLLELKHTCPKLHVHVTKLDTTKYVLHM